MAYADARDEESRELIDRTPHSQCDWYPSIQFGMPDEPQGEGGVVGKPIYAYHPNSIRGKAMKIFILRLVSIPFIMFITLAKVSAWVLGETERLLKK